MSFEKKEPRRLGIYFFFDENGVVDLYNVFLLNGMRKHVSEILVVCNGNLTEKGKAVFASCADKVLVRENEGFDVWAYKEALASYGWEKLQNDFDEIILFNFTIYGPVYPFEEMFASMDFQDVDFWGITVGNETHVNPWKQNGLSYQPAHIQSHFIAIRSPMFNSHSFHKYWDSMCKITCYEDAIAFHEVIFTKHFSDIGFKWKTYVETNDIDQNTTVYPLLICPLELVKNRRCPIVKRKSFFVDIKEYIHSTMGEPAYELFAFIKNETDFDEDLILQNLLRSCNQYDIRNCLQLNYILPSNMNQSLPGNRQKKIALFLHIYYADLIEKMFFYAQSMPIDADVYITTDSVEKKEKIQNVFSELSCNMLHTEIIPNRGRDVGALLIAFAKYAPKYDYICFAHDKKSKNVKPYTAGESFSYLCFESILKSKQYVENIIAVFEENPRLGILSPPAPYHSSFYSIMGREWGSNFLNCERLAKELKLTVDMNPEKPPIAPLGTEFWFRGEALTPLFDYGFTYDNFPDEQMVTSKSKKSENILHCIERIYSFVAQQQGFFAAWVMPESIAAMEITMLNYYQRSLGDAFNAPKTNQGHRFPQQLALAREQRTFVTVTKKQQRWLADQLKKTRKAMHVYENLLFISRKDMKWLQKQCDAKDEALLEAKQAITAKNMPSDLLAILRKDMKWLQKQCDAKDEALLEAKQAITAKNMPSDLLAILRKDMEWLQKQCDAKDEALSEAKQVISAKNEYIHFLEERM